ncbi:hypothetical protein JCM10213_006866 [Rhodosporidiobolus nylandii]
MPVPPLPNELVTLIFEHLYRLLRVHAARTFLSHPEAASFVFHHLSLVSRTWYRLALPFLGRHVDAHTYTRFGVGGFLQRNELCNEVRSMRCAPAENGYGGLDEIIQAHAFTLERLYIVRSLRRDASYHFFPVDNFTSAFPSLREFRVDFRESGSFRILPLLQSLAYSAPRLQILHITAGRDRLTTAAQPHDGVARFSSLTQLTVKVHAEVKFVSEVIVPLLIEPSQNSLEGLTLDISLPTWQTALPFADLVPCSFPRLLCALSSEHLAHLRRVSLNPGKVTDDQLEELEPSMIRLATWATSNAISLCGTDDLISLCTPREVFSTLPRLTIRSSATDELDLAPSDSEDEDDSSEESASEDETKSDDSGAYDEEYEDDWDAEDSPVFRERWSKDKRLRYELENAFPHHASDFPSDDAFEAAKQAAVEAMKPFLLAGGAGGGSAGDEVEQTEEGE